MKGNVHGGKQLGKEKKRLTFLVSEETHAKLFELAKSKEKSVSDIARDIIKDYIAKHEA